MIRPESMQANGLNRRRTDEAPWKKKKRHQANKQGDKFSGRWRAALNSAASNFRQAALDDFWGATPAPSLGDWHWPMKIFLVPRGSCCHRLLIKQLPIHFICSVLGHIRRPKRSARAEPSMGPHLLATNQYPRQVIFAGSFWPLMAR